jgi:hypothetical protein
VGSGVAKAQPTDIVDSGWITFHYVQIKSIKVTKEKKYDKQFDYNRELTPNERAARARVMAHIPANLEDKGILKQAREEGNGQ